MKDLKKITDIVKFFLTVSPSCRNSDDVLYLLVLNQFGMDNCMTVRNFLLERSSIGLPPFESVRRARQKLQAKYPELRACDAVAELRAENEVVFREYARS